MGYCFLYWEKVEVNFSLMSVCTAPTCSHQSFDGSSYYVHVDVEEEWTEILDNGGTLDSIYYIPVHGFYESIW
jgi:hypothetical protein